MTSTFRSSATQYGIDNEMNAIAKYEEQTGTKCEKSGLRVQKLYQFIAGSPDGLVNDGLIEIKCPYSYRNFNPDVACLNFGIKN